MEIHIPSETDPFDMAGHIDFDVVFRDEVDQTTFELRVGCGGCAYADPLVRPPLALKGYEKPVIEGFTQTLYRSVFPKEKRRFNSSLLNPSLCPDAHFGIRLIDFGNRSDGRPIVWGGVVGIGETFTLVEILEFPLYILKNHGSEWNDLGWTIWFNVFVAAPVVIALFRTLRRRVGYRNLDSEFAKISRGDKPTITLRNVDVREVCYDMATLAFTVAILEQVTHLIYCQVQVPLENGFWIGLGVSLIPNLLGLAFVFTVWSAMRAWRDPSVEPSTLKFMGRPEWAPGEIVVGILFLFLFGAGLWAGPAAIALAGLFRLAENWREPVDTSEKIVYAPPGDAPSLLRLSL